MSLSLGKLRGLQQLSDDAGILSIIAIDHRDPMVAMLERRDGRSSRWEEVAAEKETLARTLAPQATGILLDPIYSAGPLIARHAVPGQVGIIVARERSGYYVNPNEGGLRHTALLSDWNAAKIKALGGVAVKLLLHYHPEAANVAAQEAVVQQVAEECRQADILFLLEPISYPLDPNLRKNDPVFAAQRPALVVESASRLAKLGADIIKAEFPTDAEHETDLAVMAKWCRRLTETIDVPWVLLSAGVDFETFARQVEIACEAGASGFAAGRAIWREMISAPDPVQRTRYWSRIAISRLRVLREIAHYRAKPWFEGRSLPHLTEGWYRDYPA